MKKDITYQGIVISSSGVFNQRTYYSPHEKDDFCRNVSKGEIDGKKVVASKWLDDPVDDFMRIYRLGENLVDLFERGGGLEGVN